MERIALQIIGLPPKVNIDKVHQYYVRLRNDEAYPITVVLKSNQDDLVYGVTISSNSNEDVEVTSEFEDTGEWEITFTAIKDGMVLDSVSQTVEVKKSKSKAEPGIGCSFIVILVFVLIIVIPVFWPQISGFFIGQIPKEITIEGAVVVGGDGHKITLVNYRNAVDPTYDQLLAFLRNDTTEQHPYVGQPFYIQGQYREGNYVCSDFAETLHNNAEKAGIRSGYVSVNVNHALNVFNTTDRGLIYVDDGGLDTIAHVVIGDKYVLEPIWPEDRSRLAGVTVSVGTVESVQIDW